MWYNTAVMKKTTIPFAALAAFASILAGCSPSDGTEELALGQKAYEAHDLKKAEKLFADCVRLSPGNADAMLYLARVKLDAGEIEEAKSWASKAEAVAGGDVDVKLVAAQVAWHAKDYDRSAELFRSVADDAGLAPELRAQGWAGVGIVEMAKERHHLARIAFLRAIRLDRRSASAYASRALRRLPFLHAASALARAAALAALSRLDTPGRLAASRAICSLSEGMVARSAFWTRVLADASSRTNISNCSSAAS